MRRQATPLLLLTTFIVAACFTYYAASDCMRYRDTCFRTNATVDESQMAPYRYRLVEPFIMRPFYGVQNRVVMAVIGYQLIFNIIIFPALFAWLSRSLNAERALLGLMIYGLVNIAAYHLWYLNLNILIEMLCIALTLVLLDRSWWVLLPIVVIASLNRETAVYLGAIYTAWHWNDGKRRGGLILIVVWAVITAGLHLILGPAAHVNGNFGGMLQYNLGNLPDAFFANLILSPIYYLIWRGYRGSSPRLKWLAWIGLAYLAAACVGGNWGEMQRYMLPVLPVWLPLMLGGGSIVSLGIEPSQ